MGNFFIALINKLIGAIGAVINFIFSILPPSPFQFLDNSVIKDYLPTLNYFLPIGEVIVIGEAWLISIGVFYGYQIVLRWIKAIE